MNVRYILKVPNYRTSRDCYNDEFTTICRYNVWITIRGSLTRRFRLRPFVYCSTAIPLRCHGTPLASCDDGDPVLFPSWFLLWLFSAIRIQKQTVQVIYRNIEPISDTHFFKADDADQTADGGDVRVIDTDQRENRVDFQQRRPLDQLKRRRVNVTRIKSQYLVHFLLFPFALFFR